METINLAMMNEAQRRKELSHFGETVVFERLAQNRYKCAFIGGNSPCFDIEAHNESKQKFLVQVKTRNHTTATGELKEDTYGLFHKNKAGDVDAQVNMAEEIARQQNATQMWATVRVDTSKKTYTICYGWVAELKNKKQIPMTPSDIKRHRKLAENEFDERIKPEWSNVKRVWGS
jgi:hypothetical protein